MNSHYREWSPKKINKNLRFWIFSKFQIFIWAKNPKIQRINIHWGLSLSTHVQKSKIMNFQLILKSSCWYSTEPHFIFFWFSKVDDQFLKRFLTWFHKPMHFDESYVSDQYLAQKFQLDSLIIGMEIICCKVSSPVIMDTPASI